MNVLVTGALGWVGSAVRETVATSHRVRAFDLDASMKNLCGEVKGDFALGSIANFADVRSAAAGQDAIIHSAFAYPGPDIEQPNPEITQPFEVNVVGTYNVLESARQEGIKRVILIAAAEDRVDHPQGVFVDRNTPYNGIGRTYDLMKRLQEETCRWFVHCHNLNVIALRLCNVVDLDLGRLRSGDSRWKRVLAGDGWVHRFDVARACVRALEVDHTGWDVFHLVGAPEGKRRFDSARAESILGMRFTTEFDPRPQSERVP